MPQLQPIRSLTTDLLRQIPVLAQLPDAKLQWIMAQGNEIWLQPGELLRAEGTPADCVFLLLEGSLLLTQRVGNQDLLLKQHDLPTLFGEVPLLMDVPLYWASGRARTSCHILELSAETFWQLMGLCPGLATAILREMIERVQEVQLLAQHRERLISLGTLAAGLAHELNNPASAARRAARELRTVFPILQTQTLKLTQKPLPEAKRQFLSTIQHEAIERARTAPALDALAQSDREDQLIAWMNHHQIANGWQLASTLVNANIDQEWLDRLVVDLDGQCLSQVLLWLEATLNVAGLLTALEHSTERIHHLVEAVQDYSSLELSDWQPTDVHAGLDSALTLLGHKLKRGIHVIRDYAEQLPMVLSHGPELEQVWMNLIDNAIDAVTDRFHPSALSHSSVSLHTNPVMIPVGGQPAAQSARSLHQQPTIWIHTRCEADTVLVEIADNGTGILPEVQPHIFEPFFTTKAVGQGTGLGLNTSYKIVERHSGDIRVLSQAGDTCFQVRLPTRC